jgi:glycosyltransferase involved in cell wall biosynthesis
MGKGKGFNAKVYQNSRKAPTPPKKSVKKAAEAARPIVLGVVTYNEADKIARFIEEHSFASIIMVDQSSSDDTVAIARRYENVQVHVANRFSRLGEDHYNLIQQLCPNGHFMLRLDADEFITKDHFTALAERATKAMEKYRASTFFIARNNYIDGELINDRYKTPSDPDGKDWQFRLSFGFLLQWDNTPHKYPTPMAPWAIIEDDIFITHLRTKDSVVDSIQKRAGSLNRNILKDRSLLEALPTIALAPGSQ